MPKKEIIQIDLAAANPNLSPATRFGKANFVQFHLHAAGLAATIRARP